MALTLYFSLPISYFLPYPRQPAIYPDR